MNIPGFTAEASIYEPNGRYRMLLSHGDAQTVGSVTPQVWRVVCAVTDTIHCGIEDFDRGISIPLF